MFDEKKHWNIDGAKILYVDEGEYYVFLIGNNDKKIEILKIKF